MYFIEVDEHRWRNSRVSFRIEMLRRRPFGHPRVRMVAHLRFYSSRQIRADQLDEALAELRHAEEVPMALRELDQAEKEPDVCLGQHIANGAALPVEELRRSGDSSGGTRDGGERRRQQTRPQDELREVGRRERLRRHARERGGRGMQVG